MTVYTEGMKVTISDQGSEFDGHSGKIVKVHSRYVTVRLDQPVGKWRKYLIDPKHLVAVAA